MKTLLSFLALFVGVTGILGAESMFGLGLGYEAGSNQGVPPASGVWGATTTDPGNTPLLQTMPELFFESVFRDNPSEGGFGVDFVMSWSMTMDSPYIQAYQPFENVYSNGEYPFGNPGISPTNPELFYSADLSYHLPRLGPLDIAVLAGGVGWSDVGDTSQVDLPISAGIAAQAGAEVTLHLGSFFVQGRGLYRFYWWEAAAIGGGGTPAPLGSECFMVLGGFGL